MSQEEHPRIQTYEHVREVQRILAKCVRELTFRQTDHDKSKLLPPEVEAFDRLSPLLSQTTYGTPEYHQLRAELGVALRHHYKHNAHHPEHWPNGIRGMSLVDLLEMLCDWLAATHRHDDGNIRKSIEINQQRFGYSDELKQVFLNTLALLEDEGR